MRKLSLILLSHLILLVHSSISNAQSVNTTSQPVNKSGYIEQSPEVIAAMEAMSKDDFKTAVNLYKQYLQKNPDNKAATIGLARAELLLGNYSEAEKLLSTYKEKFGEDTVYLTEKARYLVLTDHPSDGLVILNQLLQKDPTNDTLLDIKQFAMPRVKHQAPVSITTTGQSPVAEQLTELHAAQESVDKRDYPKAEQFYLSYISKNPNDKTANIGLVRVKLWEGNYTEARNLLILYKKKFGQDKNYLKEKSRYLTFIGHHKEALIVLAPLLINEPTNTELLDIKKFAVERMNSKTTTENANTNNLPGPAPAVPAQNPELNAAAEAANGQNYAKAVQLYQAYLQKNPNDKTALLGLARVKLWQNQLAEGKKILTHYKNKFGEDDEYLTEHARYFALANKPKQALAILEPLLKKDPTNQTFLSIKQYALSHPEIKVKAATSPTQTADRLARIAQAKGSNAALFAEAAQAYYAASDTKKALVMINRALIIDYTNGNYLLLKAKFTNELGDIKTTFELYKRLYMTNCNHPAVILGYARAATAANKLDLSEKLYWIYISRYPNEQKPWLEYAYVQSWRGNDRLAIWTLDEYQARFGDSADYLIERARIVASANRPTPALNIVRTLWPTQSKNYDLNYANTIALFYNNQPVEMFASLAKVKELQPNTEETRGLNDFIRTPFRSNVSFGAYDSFDSDTVKIGRATLTGQYFLSPRTSLLATVSAERLSASIGSGLAPIEGGHALELYRLNVGANHRFTPNLALQGMIGDGSATDGENALIYQGIAFIEPTDTTEFDLQVKRDFYDQSAHAVSRGVKQNLYQMQFFWQPCIQCYLMLNTSYANFTDGNRMTYEELNPAINIIATEVFNIRLGVDGTFYRFSKRLSNGYYSPLNYRYYGGIADIYWKQNENIGYEFAMGLGTQKDDTFITYRAANDFSATGYFGVYRDWYLVLTAAASTRGRSIANNPDSGTYRVYAFNATLTRRFD